MNTPITLYGIKNCDTVKKARIWLDAHQIDYRFHDFRVDGVSPALLKHFADQVGIDSLLNQRSTSWRQLDAALKVDLTAEKALQLMRDVPTLIKRPVLDDGKRCLVGFNPELYASLS